MNIIDLKPGDIISYGSYVRLGFSIKNEYSMGEFHPKQSSLFLILEIKKFKHDRIKHLYTIKFLVENKICYNALAQEDIEKFKFYYASK